MLEPVPIFETPKIDGQVVPIIGERPGASVAPPTLTGHGLDGGHQIVLGAVTLASLHKHIGDEVTLRARLRETRPPSSSVSSGTATMPTIGQGTRPPRKWEFRRR